MSVLFNVVFKWGNIQLIFMMYHKKFLVVYKWGSIRLYLWCIIKGSSNIIMGYKYDIIYISFSLFSNLLFPVHKSLFHLRTFSHIIYLVFIKRFLFWKIFKYQYLWLKIVFNKHNSNVIYINMILINVFFYMRKIWYDKQKIFIRTEGVQTQFFFT